MPSKLLWGSGRILPLTFWLETSVCFLTIHKSWGSGPNLWMKGPQSLCCCSKFTWVFNHFKSCACLNWVSDHGTVLSSDLSTPFLCRNSLRITNTCPLLVKHHHPVGLQRPPPPTLTFHPPPTQSVSPLFAGGRRSNKYHQFYSKQQMSVRKKPKKGVVQNLKNKQKKQNNK